MNSETGDAASGQSKVAVLRRFPLSLRDVRSIGSRRVMTPKWHYILIVAPGHRNFIKNMTGENHKASEIQEQRLVNVSRLITLGSEADPHRREQDGVRHCRLQAGKVQSSPH